MVDVNVGPNKAVSTTISLSGIAAGNYRLTQPSGITVNITQAPLTIDGVTAVDREYNGSIYVELDDGELDGVIEGDEDYVIFKLGTGTMANANVGQGKAVTTNITLSGTASANYTLTQPTNITVNITTSADIALNMNNFKIEDLGKGVFAVGQDLILSGVNPLTISLTDGITAGEWRWGYILLPHNASDNSLTLYASQFGENKGLVTLSVSFVEDGKEWLGSIEITVE
jgi:hypothetical protein